ncbi:MAG: hypothetical protein GHCLOJNM_00213 [bacterium]|nr:hypothetical protein [bacterium]
MSGSLLVPPDSSSLTEEDRLLRCFYSWEYRGRGWVLHDLPVELEPPFCPFTWTIPARPVVDDGQRHTLLSGLVSLVREGFRKPKPLEEEPEFEVDEPEPETVQESGLKVEIEVTAPTGYRVSHESTRRFLQALRYLQHPLGFEIVGTGETIGVQFACHAEDAEGVSAQLAAFFPDCAFSRTAGGTRTLWEGVGDSRTLVVDFGLAREFMLPLYTFGAYDPDPLTAIGGAMQGLQPGESAVFQVLLQPVSKPWVESIRSTVFAPDGKPIFEDADMAKLTREKLGSELFAAVVRMAVRSGDRSRVWPLMRSLGGALAQYNRLGSNELIPLTNQEYDDAEHEEDLIRRRTRRSGMILNAEEVLSLVHPPSASVRSPKLRREIEKTRAVPALATDGALILGINRHQGREAPVTLTPDQRNKHLYVVGATGTGKSTFLLQLIRQDLEQGNGFAVLDPHGDLIDAIIGYLTKDRLDDVILLDPSDEEYSVGLNILAAHSPLEKTLLSSDLVSVFQRLSTSWGDQMTSVLGNAILAFLESSEGGTLRDLRRFLVDSAFRNRFLKTVQDPDVRYYWEREFPLLSGKPQAPILTRLDTFLRPKPIRSMVAQKESRLDFRALMDSGKILLARLSQGAIGEENAYLLGSLLVSKFHQVALSRQEQREEDRRPFSLFIDECHHFVTPSLTSILAGARKYRLSLILAHQELRQLGTSDLASAVLTHPYTRVCFRVGDQDAKKLAEGFSFFEASDLLNLGTGEAIARVERAEYDFNLSVPPLPPLDEHTTHLFREYVTAATRGRYGRSRAEVEAELAREFAEDESVRPKQEKGPVPEPPREETVLAEAPADIQPSPPSEPEGRVEGHEVVEIPPLPPVVPQRPRPKPILPPTPGRGGKEHKYLQQMVKQKGEELGYRVSVEKTLPGGGCVDVSLESEVRSIACEISVTSTPEQEIGNVRKCLDAGYARVVLVVADSKRVPTLSATISGTLSDTEKAKVEVCTLPELLLLLDELGPAHAERESHVRGFRVKTKHAAGASADRERRKQAIADVMAKSVGRSGRTKPKKG